MRLPFLIVVNPLKSGDSPYKIILGCVIKLGEKENNENALSWYLKRDWIAFFAFILPPLAYLVIFLNYNKFDRDLRSYLLFFTTLMLSVWLLKFLPHNTFTFILLCVAVAVSTLLIIMKFVISLKD